VPRVMNIDYPLFKARGMATGHCFLVSIIYRSAASRSGSTEHVLVRRTTVAIRTVDGRGGTEGRRYDVSDGAASRG